MLRGTLYTGIVAFLVALVTNRPPGMEGVKNKIVFPLFAIAAFAITQIQARWPDQHRRWAWLTFGTFASYMLLELVFYFLWMSAETGADVRILMMPLLAWLPLLLVIAFVILEAEDVLRAAVGYAVLVAMPPAVFLLLRDGPPDHILYNALFQQFVAAPTAYIVLLRFTVLLSEAFVTSRSESRQFEELALRDELTGLPNRRATHRALDQALAHHDRAVLSAGVVLIDLDHFKAVNDNHGHHVGDAVLKHVARVLRQQTRRTDTIGRWGGEEFLLVLSGRSPINVGVVVERFRSAIEAASLESPPLCITASLGAALAQPDEAIESLLRRADEALYEAKAMGRNRGVVASVTPKR